MSLTDLILAGVCISRLYQMFFMQLKDDINKPLADTDNNHGEEDSSFLNVNAEITTLCSSYKQVYY